MTPKSKVKVDWELFTYASRLEPLVRAKGPSGSTLVKAFALLRRRWDVEGSPDRETMALVKAAVNEWNLLTRAEQRHILGGWHPVGMQPSAQAYLKTQGNYDDNEVFWGLEIHASADRKEIDIGADWHISQSTAPVVLQVKSGTDKTAALRLLMRAMTALEEHWGEAISLGEGDGMIYVQAMRREV